MLRVGLRTCGLLYTSAADINIVSGAINVGFCVPLYTDVSAILHRTTFYIEFVLSLLIFVTLKTVNKDCNNDVMM